MTDIGVGQGGVAVGTFCRDTTGKADCGVGVSKASERQRVDCALVHTLRNSATLGSRMCLALLQWRPALTHLPQESVSLEHHSMWMDLHFILIITRRTTRTEMKVCLLICVTKGIVEIMQRKLFFHFRTSDVRPVLPCPAVSKVSGRVPAACPGPVSRPCVPAACPFAVQCPGAVSRRRVPAPCPAGRVRPVPGPSGRARPAVTDRPQPVRAVPPVRGPSWPCPAAPGRAWLCPAVSGPCGPQPRSVHGCNEGVPATLTFLVRLCQFVRKEDGEMAWDSLLHSFRKLHRQGSSTTGPAALQGGLTATLEGRPRRSCVSGPRQGSVWRSRFENVWVEKGGKCKKYRGRGRCSGSSVLSLSVFVTPLVGKSVSSGLL